MKHNNFLYWSALVYSLICDTEGGKRLKVFSERCWGEYLENIRCILGSENIWTREYPDLRISGWENIWTGEYLDR